MAAVHEQWVIELLGGLNGTEQAQIYRLLAKLKAARYMAQAEDLF